VILPYGKLGDGTLVQTVTLGDAEGLQAEVLTYGGILRQLTLPGRGGPHNLVVTLPDLDAYVRDTTFQGTLVGRVANRIAGARFTLNGRTHTLTANQGPNQLHGGTLGFGKRVWRVLSLQGSRLWLGLHSPAGEEGFPGTLDVTAEVTVDGTELRLRFEAQGDEATPVNLTYHPYFNLSGDPARAVDDMLLRIPASSFLPVRDSLLIPTGDVASVAGTPFDFRDRREVRAPRATEHAQLGFGGGYDHCWVLNASRDYDAELHSPHSDVTMTIHSDRPGIQFYGGQYLPATHPGLNGICLEPQGFPNAVNEPAFPPVILDAGELFSTTFTYRFTSGA
jgi:aldose 1-epimerase